jgi:phage head maturation protease
MPHLLWAPFSKVEEQDDGTLKVFGVASSESRDSDGEIIKAEAVRRALPDYLEYGNVREMHQPIAAGVALEASVDADGITNFGAHIVDPGSVKKVQTGVLKGFSLGGKVTKRSKTDKSVVEGITLTEISLVDRPANPDARITLAKADKSGALQIVDKVAERSDTSASEGEGKYGDVTFADPTNKKYPIDTVEHIRAAWNYINKPKNSGKYSAKDASAIKRRIIAAWKAKIDKDGPPSAAKTTEKAMAGEDLHKGLYDVSRLADLLQGLFWCYNSSRLEADMEGDGSSVPGQLREGCIMIARSLRDMVEEETAELLGLGTLDDDDLLDSAAKAIAAGDLCKAGRRFSKSTAEAIGELHKMCKDMETGFGKLGYDSTDDNEGDDMADDAKKAAGSDDLAKSITALTERLEKAEGSIEKMTGELTSTKEALTKAQTDLGAVTTERDQLIEESAKMVDFIKAKGAIRAVPKEADTIGKGADGVDEKDEDFESAFKKSMKAGPITLNRKVG